MGTVTKEQLRALCRAALEAEDDWRTLGPEARKAAYHRFEGLLRAIAELTGRTYEEVFAEAIEDWVKVHFCEAATER